MCCAIYCNATGVKRHMGQATLPGNPPVEITLRRSARARRVSLRVSALDGRVTLSLPKRMPLKTALAFAEEKADWIRSHLANQVEAIIPQVGGTILFEGTELPIIPGKARTATTSDGVLIVPGTPDMVPARVRAFLKLAARTRLHAASRKYADRLGVQYSGITLRDTRSRWGSCSSTRGLSYSWRLVMAPPEVLDYVAAHEVSHILEMNHSAAYWAVVAGIYPDYAAPRAWLRNNGSLLHRYRFDQ